MNAGQCRIFVLAARVAAVRLIRFRRGAPGKTWTPVVLRWRRRLPRQIRGAAHPGIAAQHLWHLQFHLHFTRLRVGQPNKMRWPASLPPSRESRRIDLKRAGTIVRAATLEQPARSIHDGPSARYAALPGVLNVYSVAKAAIYPARRPAAASAGHPARRPAPLVLSHLRLEILRPNTPGYDIIRPLGARVPARLSELPSHSRAPNSPHSAEISRRPRSARHGQQNRAPELVWSSSRPAPEAVGPLKSGSEDSPGPGRRSSGSGPAPVAEQVVSLPRVSAAPITVLDPALLDRLTDDVIRRVERRVRIERERRGV